MTAGSASATHTSNVSSSLKYSRRQRPSTVTVTPSAPPSDVSPMLTSAPAPTSACTPSPALLSRSFTASIAAPLPLPSNQSAIADALSLVQSLARLLHLVRTVAAHPTPGDDYASLARQDAALTFAAMWRLAHDSPFIPPRLRRSGPG